jgi:hypothetical protein
MVAVQAQAALPNFFFIWIFFSCWPGARPRWMAVLYLIFGESGSVSAAQLYSSLSA